MFVVKPHSLAAVIQNRLVLVALSARPPGVNKLFVVNTKEIEIIMPKLTST